MQRLTITLFLILIAIILCNAQDKQKITIKANWKIGETKEMIHLTTHSWTGTEEYDHYTHDTIAIYSISIINKFHSGYLVTWKADEVSGLDEYPDGISFMQFFLNHFKYVIETDTNGNYVALKNWNYLLKLTHLLRIKISAFANKEGISKRELNNYFSETPLATSKEEITEMCQSLTGIFHALYGEEYILNDTIVEYKRMDNPNIPEGIPYYEKVIASPLENGNISIKYIVEYDYDEGLKLLKKYFPDQEDYGEEKNINYSEYIYNPYTGWIEKITIYFETDFKYGKSKTIIEYIFE